MKRFYVLFLSIVLIPSILFAWTEPTGSTFTVTSTESQEVKDILNDVHDSVHASLQVTNISTGPYHSQAWIWNGSDWIKWEGSPSSYDGQNVSSTTIGTRSFLYGFNGTSWDRLRDDEMKYLYTRTSSNSIILQILNPVTTYMTISQYDGIINKFIAQYVLSSTNTATIMVEMIKHYLLISTGGDTTITRLDTIDTELIKNYVLSSTNTATIMTELIKEYLLMSTGSDTTIARLDTINNELIEHYVLHSTDTAKILTEMDKHYVLISTGNDVTIVRLNTIDTELIKHYVLISTGTDGTNTRIDSVNANLDKIYVLISTSTSDSDDLLNKLYVQNSTGIDTTVTRLDTINTELIKNYVVTSTGSDVAISRLDSLLLELYGIARSSGMDTAITRLDSLRNDLYGVARSTGIDAINTELIKHYVLSSTNSATILTELIKEYVLTSTGTDGIIARLDGLISGVTTSLILSQYEELKAHTTIFLTISQLNNLKEDSTTYIRGGIIDEVKRILESSCVVKNFPTDYPDSASASAISGLDTTMTNLYNQSRSSFVVVDMNYVNKTSTGTTGKLLISGTISIPGNIDGYSFYSIGGDTLINANWKAGTLYCIDGIPIAPTKISIPVINPVLNCVLNYGTTLYYDLNSMQ